MVKEIIQKGQISISLAWGSLRDKTEFYKVKTRMAGLVKQLSEYCRPTHIRIEARIRSSTEEYHRLTSVGRNPEAGPTL